MTNHFVFLFFFLTMKRHLTQNIQQSLTCYKKKVLMKIMIYVYILRIYISPTIICLHKSIDKIKIGKKMRQGGGYDIV